MHFEVKINRYYTSNTRVSQIQRAMVLRRRLELRFKQYFMKIYLFILFRIIFYIFKLF